MYQAGGTIGTVLKYIEKHAYVLPAIQREFVWSPEQIACFFDSIMQGYPFGTFLFWRVEPENSDKFKFYDFVRDYHQRDNPHCLELDLLPNQQLTAVLDGQQRMTALNIALRGSLALKEPRKWWSNPDAFPRRQLYLNLLAERGDGEQGEAYDFRFLSENEARARQERHLENESWFPVSRILRMSDGPQMLEFLQAQEVTDNNLKRAFQVLDRLYRVIHTERSIAYYEETSQDLDKVLHIFIRMNSGGTVLSYSDLLLSIAVAQWRNKDARREIHTLVDEMNQNGGRFAFTHDLILKAGLMLTDIGSVGFKVENFNHANMAKLEASWDGIRDALLLTVRLVESFGFTRQTIRAHSAILPICYYLYRKEADERFLTHSAYRDEREAIRGWLVRSLLKASGIWGSGLDTLLTALRTTIVNEGTNAFPAQALGTVMARRGKSLRFEADEIYELLDIEYSDRRVFALLSLCYPFVDFRNQFHIDHVFPRALTSRARLRRAGIPDEDIPELQEKVNRLPNLQLLEGHINEEKQAKPPRDWAKAHFPDEQQFEGYCARHDLVSLPSDVTKFDNFFDKRREALRTRVEKVLGQAAGAGEAAAE